MTRINLVCPDCMAINRLPPERLGEAPRCGACHKPLFTAHPLNVDGPRLDRHLSHDEIPVLVDIWAPWCSPCRSMAPHYEQAAALLEPKVRLLKLDSDSSPEISARYGVRSIPTLMLFNHGNLLAESAGAVTSAQIVQWVRQHAKL